MIGGVTIRPERERRRGRGWEGGGHSLRALGTGDTVGENTSGGGGGDTLTETDEEAGDEERGEGDVRASAGDEGTEGPEHHTSEEDELAAVLLREPAAGDLGESVTPEESGLDRLPSRRRSSRSAQPWARSPRTCSPCRGCRARTRRRAQRSWTSASSRRSVMSKRTSSATVSAATGPPPPARGTTVAARLGERRGRGDRGGRGEGNSPRLDRSPVDGFAGVDLARRNRGAADDARGTARGNAGTGRKQRPWKSRPTSRTPLLAWPERLRSDGLAAARIRRLAFAAVIAVLQTKSAEQVGSNNERSGASPASNLGRGDGRDDVPDRLYGSLRASSFSSFVKCLADTLPATGGFSERSLREAPKTVSKKEQVGTIVARDVWKISIREPSASFRIAEANGASAACPTGRTARDLVPRTPTPPLLAPRAAKPSPRSTDPAGPTNVDRRTRTFPPRLAPLSREARTRGPPPRRAALLPIPPSPGSLAKR